VTRNASPTRTSAPLQHLPDVNNAVAGVWALKACSTVAQVQAADVQTALQMAGVRGFSMRVPWSVWWSNGAPGDPLGLIAAAQTMVATYGQPGARLRLRFVAGTSTPADVLAACRSYVGDGSDPCITSGLSAPVPFHTDGTVNSEFVALFTQEANWFYGQCLAVNAALASLPHWGDNFAELNNGAQLRGLTGYSYANWLTAHKALINVIDAIYAANGFLIPYEHPLTGCGPLSGAFPASNDIGAYLANLRGLNTYVSAQGTGLNPWGVGFWGTTSQATEILLRAGYNNNVGHLAQMINPIAYTDTQWRQIINACISQRVIGLEVYVGAGFSGITAARVAEFNKYLTTARSASPTRTPA
jgi:hypothetical protein